MSKRKKRITLRNQIEFLFNLFKLGFILLIIFAVCEALLVFLEYWYITIAFIVFIFVLARVGYQGKSKRRKSNVSINMSKIDEMGGVEFEETIVDLIKRQGFVQVNTTPKSGDYGVDIVASKNGEKYAFQCKRYSGNVGVKAIQEVHSGAPIYEAKKCVVVTNSRFTNNASILAAALNVELWDRDKLEELIIEVKYEEGLTEEKINS